MWMLCGLLGAYKGLKQEDRDTLQKKLAKVY